ncbi:MAG: MFS siderochrome iron transporter 1 [Claussenomyces sp. TS43310]|nr:MAG: MFS siderochrome iron transporter 1 [Claussenomyces sp. TS43310]
MSHSQSDSPETKAIDEPPTTEASQQRLDLSPAEKLPSRVAVSASQRARATPSALEAQTPRRKRPSHFRLVFDQTLVTDQVLNHPYRGSGTTDDPFVVEYLPNDARNPMLFPQWVKWAITILVATATLAVALVSSAYTGGLEQIVVEFHSSDIVGTLGISLFVLGFAIGPLLWAPLSELYGRQILYIGTYAALTAFNAGAAGSKGMPSLLVMRFFAGAFGSSPLTNSGGIIADMFPSSQRGLAMTLFAAAPSLGPAIGPICGGFLGQAAGWRWVEGFLAAFTGAIWIIGSLTIPETYSPVILRRRAAKMSKMTGKCYVSKLQVEQGPKTVTHELKTAIIRPWILLFMEPIVLVLSVFQAIVYGTLYLTFAAFPIVYQEDRGWSLGIGGLAFLGIAVGIICAVIYSLWDNARYVRVLDSVKGRASPEARLPPGMVGSVALPISLFWFAWTNSPSIHWSVSIIATAPFGFGMTLIFLSIVNYLIDAYVIYAASVLAANTVLRSLFGAAFPLFTTDMYNNLGIHWASSIPAFLALACVPFPFVLHRYGAAIRLKCKYSAAAAAVLEQLRQSSTQKEEVEEKQVDEKRHDKDPDPRKIHNEDSSSCS